MTSFSDHEKLQLFLAFVGFNIMSKCVISAGTSSGGIREGTGETFEGAGGFCGAREGES